MTEQKNMLIGGKLARLAAEQPIENANFEQWRQAVETIDTEALQRLMRDEPEKLDVIFGDDEDAARQFVQQNLITK